MIRRFCVTLEAMGLEAIHVESALHEGNGKSATHGVGQVDHVRKPRCPGGV